MSAIEWTDDTWNPTTGCTKVSRGCDNCYMFPKYLQLNSQKKKPRGYEFSPDVVQMIPERLETPLRWRKPRRVFVNSMSDLFHPDVTYDFITQVFRVMGNTPKHTYQILTKRPGRMVDWWQKEWGVIMPRNVWMGVSVEDQRRAPNIEVLNRANAMIRFVSAEPLLERVDLSEYLNNGMLDWVIVGGESGPNARPMDLDWAEDLLEQCAKAGVPFFLKQLGGRVDKRGGDKALLRGQTWREYPR